MVDGDIALLRWAEYSNYHIDIINALTYMIRYYFNLYKKSEQYVRGIFLGYTGSIVLQGFDDDLLDK